MDKGLIQHKGLAESGRWAEMPFAQQMANIGSEVFRAGKWKQKGKTERAQNAADRALELLDFTVQAMADEHRNTKELLRMRELLCDFFYGGNLYASSAESLNGYFEPFSLKAARQRLLMLPHELQVQPDIVEHAGDHDGQGQERERLLVKDHGEVHDHRSGDQRRHKNGEPGFLF